MENTERSSWVAVDSEHTTLLTWFLPPSCLICLCEPKTGLKKPLFWKKISHLQQGGLVNKCYGSHGCGARRTAEPYLLQLVSACECVFLSLWRCKGSMVGHTSAHKRVCIHPCRHAHKQTKVLKHTAPCNKATKNNRHLLLKPQCLQWSQIRASPWQP